MKIATWNVNSVRARIEHLLNWLRKESPDIVCLQETKCINEAFPSFLFDELGYNIYLNGQKSYNGVAILSKIAVDDILFDFPLNPDISQKRFLEITLVLQQNNKTYSNILKIISVYVPNGQEINSEKFLYKLDFLDKFTKYLQTINKPENMVVVCGDFNIVNEVIDLYDSNLFLNSLCCSKDEISAFRSILNIGYIDSYRNLNVRKQEFTWWDYRGLSFQKNKGLRIDYILVTNNLRDILKTVTIDIHERSIQKSSDHAPVILEIGYNDV